jgi:hypothetical protein
MNLTGIIAISGKPGLFKVVAQGKSNLIVESLEDGKRIPAYSSDRISSLEDISVYTYEEDQILSVVFESIYKRENGGLAPSHKEDKNTLEGYLLEILPNYDQERVYFSDVKKIFQWYNLLNKSGNLIIDEPVKEEPKEEKPTKKTSAKKIESTESTEEAPKKTRAPRKKVEKTVE